MLRGSSGSLLTNDQSSCIFQPTLGSLSTPPPPYPHLSAFFLRRLLPSASFKKHICTGTQLLLGYLATLTMAWKLGRPDVEK